MAEVVLPRPLQFQSVIDCAVLTTAISAQASAQWSAAELHYHTLFLTALAITQQEFVHTAFDDSSGSRSAPSRTQRCRAR